MRVFLTGGTGFIGSALAAALRDRGDDVVALVRTPGKASGLAALGCELVEGDLGHVGALRDAMSGCDAVIHAAAQYEVGIPASARDAMVQTNVVGTQNVLDAAAAAEVPRVVYVSTAVVFGDTGGAVVDETADHSGPYLSTYDETKHRAHQIAVRKAAEGLPLVIVMPSTVYGPGDHSWVTDAIRLFLSRRLPAIPLATGAFSFVHRDDVVSGIIAALDRGRLGERYILSGERTTMRGFIETLASVTGRRAPRFDVPTPLLKTLIPLGPVLGPALGMGRNVRESIASGQATYLASHDKATAELGYQPRPLADGLRETLAAEGRR
jgi:nucleoside-diphosphate-sugar epimerase